MTSASTVPMHAVLDTRQQGAQDIGENIARMATNARNGCEEEVVSNVSKKKKKKTASLPSQTTSARFQLESAPMYAA